MTHTVIDRPSPKFVAACARLKFLLEGGGQTGAIDTFNIPPYNQFLPLPIPLKVVLEEIP